MTPSIRRASSAYLSSVLKGGDTLVQRGQRTAPLDALGVRRRQYRYAHLERLLVATAYSDGVVYLFATDGKTAFGPLDVEEAVAIEVKSEGGCFRHEGEVLPCLTDICPALCEALAGVDIRSGWDKLALIGRLDEEGLLPDEKPHLKLRASDGRIAGVNPVYFQAAIRHICGRHGFNTDRLSMLQRVGNALGPILFTGTDDRIAVVMPMRIY